MNNLVWLFEDIDGNRYSAFGSTSFRAKMELRQIGVTCKLYTLWAVPVNAKPI